MKPGSVKENKAPQLHCAIRQRRFSVQTARKPFQKKRKTKRKTLTHLVACSPVFVIVIHFCKAARIIMQSPFFLFFFSMLILLPWSFSPHNSRHHRGVCQLKSTVCTNSGLNEATSADHGGTLYGRRMTAIAVMRTFCYAMPAVTSRKNKVIKFINFFVVTLSLHTLSIQHEITLKR
jgi:hypothetical protein